MYISFTYIVYIPWSKFRIVCLVLISFYSCIDWNKRHAYETSQDCH